MANPYSYLALGDSYTIGEGVPIHESFPYQTVQLLRNMERDVFAPEIIAKTGWTSGELLTAIDQTKLFKYYYFVTLLVGVNNQYRGKSVKEYEDEFRQVFMRGYSRTPNMIVLSIPDWGATPFAADRDRAQISREIDAFNEVNRTIAEKHHAHYIDITPGTRNPTDDLLAADKLHPSGKEYRRWAEAVAEIVKNFRL